MSRLIAHVSVGARDMHKAAVFYDAVMAAFGARRLMDFMPYAIGYGVDETQPEFWVQVPSDQQPASAGNGVHFCFRAGTRAAVHAFHAAGLKAGGRDAGSPGLRPDYSPDYYAAFLFDLDGNKIEAVCFGA